MTDSSEIIAALSDNEIEKKILSLLSDQSLSDEERIKELVQYLKAAKQ